MLAGVAYDFAGKANSSMGVDLGDFDNDSWPDLFVACGHFDPIELIDDGTAKKVRNYLLRNHGNGRTSSGGANDQPSLLRNDLVETRKRLMLQLVGTRTNRDGVNAFVKVFSDQGVQVAEVHSGRGYQSHYGSCLYFGFSEEAKPNRVEVSWLGGETDVFAIGSDAENLLLIEGGDFRVLNMPTRNK